jgi:electron transfer flavoprotein alpha subunit
MPRIFVYVPHRNGVPDDLALELAAAARRIDPSQSPTAVATGWGQDLDAVCASLRTSFAEVWKLSGAELDYPNAEVVREALVLALPPRGILLVPHNHFGVDLSPGLSVKINAAYVADVLDFEPVEGTSLRLVRQEFAGQVNTHVLCDVSAGAVLNVRPGAFQPAEAAATAGLIREIAVGPIASRRRYLSTVAPEAGDIDITKYKVLVSIGRGIQEPDNVRVAQELADALGGAVSCSRPVVDAKWMDKSRQVGSSGKSVRPKVYLACGISGSFQHLAGLKGNPFLIAINKNPRAPIFRVADVGIVDDLLEFLPELTSKIRAEHSAPVK